jgi:type II secretory pathway predicted ATPase ExeA
MRSIFLPIVPTVIRAVIADFGISQSAMAKQCAVSPATISLVVSRHQYPRTNPVALREKIASILREKSVPEATILAALDNDLAAYPKAVELFETNPPVSNVEANITPDELADNANRKTIRSTKQPELEYNMIPKVSLTPAAKIYHKLFRCPFSGEITCKEDYYRSPDVLAVREAIWDVVNNGKFVALIGESGCGKTTMLQDLHERIATEGKQVIIAAPHVLGMENKVAKGKTTMSAAQITHCLISSINSTVSIKSNPEAMFRQLHQLLLEARKQHTKVALIIEEAHGLPDTVLKQLKRFLELRDGHATLLGIVLIAQPELHQTLSPRNPAVREVYQRVEVIDMPPLDEYLAKYLAFKFARVQRQIGDFLDESAVAAILTRLTQTRSTGRTSTVHSQCYPLAVNNMMVHLLNASASIKSKIDADLVNSVTF